MVRKLLFIFFILSSYILKSQTFSINPNSIINDNSTTDFPILVSGLSPANIDTFNFGLETVCINLTHTWDADLNIYIISPDGTTVMLVSGQGGSDDNYTNTCFNVYSTQTIPAGSAPFTGTFKPMGQMGRVNNGQNGNGTWILRVVDTYAQDDGTVLSFSLTFGNNPANYFSIHESDLPIFVINSNGQQIPNDPKIMADLGVVWNGDGIRNHLTDTFNNYNGKIGIELRGASSLSFPKKQYSVELWDINSNSIDSSLCGLPAENDWVLSAQYPDKSLMRGMLSFHLIREMGWYAPRCKPVELIINGEYLGVYVLMEKVKRDNNRINISKLQTTDISGDQLTGGYILQLDKNSGNADPGWNSPYLPWPSGDSIFINYIYPDGATIVPQQSAYIKAYVDSFETSLIGPNFMDQNIGFRKYANINSCVDAFIIQELSKSIDAYRKSFYLYKDKDSKGGKLVMAPIWDYDLTYGNAGFCEGENFAGWQYNFNYVCGGDYWLNPFWYERMVQDSLFNNQVRCRWEELRETILSQNYLNNWIDSTANYMNESQGWNFTIWPILGSYVWPNYYIGQNLQEEIDTLKWWLFERINWLDNNLPGNSNNCNPTGINNSYITVNNTKIYPNPFINEINFSLYLLKPDKITITIFNTLGQKVMLPIEIQGTTKTNNINIKLPQILPSGLYVMQINTANKTWTQNISKIE
ncbi:MAG: CotH kinase family protein [Bacteroidia bacterium]|nr:CotH kinase family protein [Bacteroidia bacterium]